MGLDLVAHFGQAAEEQQVWTMATYFVLFAMMHNLFEFLVPRTLSNQTLKTLSQQQVFEICAYLNSFFHAVVCSALCLAVFCNPDGTMAQDKMHGHSPNASRIFAFTSAYFLWDLTIVFRSPKLDLAFLLHHVGGALVYLTAQHPFMQYYSLGCLLYEISTPFLNLRTVLLTIGMKGSPMLRRVELLFAVSFFLVRICFGLPFSAMGIFHGASEVLAGTLPNPWHYATLLCSNVALNTLNVVWMSKIFKLATRKTA